MSCDPEKVTGYVDEALDEAEHAAIFAHLADCPSCRQQVEEERDVRAHLRAVPSPEPRPAFEEDLRRRLAGRPRRALWLLPLAASLAFLALWARGAAPFVAYELARDHAHCFGRPALPAKVWSDDSRVIAAWFEDQGTTLPPIPEDVAGLGLVGARYCPLLDRFAAHLYYTGGDRHASLFVLKGPARFQDTYEGRIGAQTVLLFRSAGTTVGIVSERAEDAEAFRRKFTRTVASLQATQP
jgi:anti-sigma factor RsiW